MTTEQATSLKATLESMFDRIAQKESIAVDLERLDRLQEEFGATVPTQLRHYLQRRSYTKALDFLNEDFVADSD